MFKDSKIFLSQPSRRTHSTVACLVGPNCRPRGLRGEMRGGGGEGKARGEVLSC